MVWGILMNVSWLTAAILTIVGIAKSLFKRFKASHPKWYRAVFFTLSIVLIAAGSILAELYIFEGSLASVEFVLLVLGTALGVIGGYASYENLGLKNGLHKLFSLVSEVKEKHASSKAGKAITKLEKQLKTLGLNEESIIKVKDVVEGEKAKVEAQVIAEEKQPEVVENKQSEVKAINV